MCLTKKLLYIYDKVFRRKLLHEYRNLMKSSCVNRATINKYQQEQLYSILDYASKNVPFYKRTLLELNLDLKRFSGIEILNKLPILTKHLIRQNLDDLLSTEYKDTKELCYDYTGGSTGQPLKFAYDNAYKDFRWAVIYNNLTWAGYKLGDCHGFAYGGNYDAKKQYSFRQKLQDWVMHSFQVNAFFLNEVELNAFVHKCIKKKPRFLIGYASALFEFSRYVEAHRLSIKFDFIESTSEYMSHEMKETIERIFKCKVYDRYGCREIGNIGHECHFHDGFHINWQAVYVEIINKGSYPWLGAEYGDIVVTSLKNKGMALFRYSIGDIGKIDESECKCGIASSRLYLAGTRSGDLLYSSDGSLISPTALTIIYRDLNGIDKIQFIQESMSKLNVNIVKNYGFTEEVSIILQDRTKKVFGSDTTINLNFVNKIEKEQSGKFRLSKRLF